MVSGSNSDATILVVEDEENLADLYADWLGDTYEVRTAYGGQAAIDLMDESVDVVLLDRMMPEMSGEAVLDRILQAGYECRIAMVTAVDPDLDIITMGFDDYVTKPVTKAELLTTVDRLLRLDSYDEQLQEFYAVTMKKATLDVQVSTKDLGASEEYADLVDRMAELKEQLDSARLDLDLDDESDALYPLFGLLDDSTTNGESAVDTEPE